MATRLNRVGITALALSLPMTGIALAAPSMAADELQITWNGPGTPSASATRTFFGTPVTVPGDSASRTLTVKNAGPSDGTLTAKIVNVRIADADKPDVHHNSNHVDPDGAGTTYAGAGDQGDWYSDLDLSWKMNGSNGHSDFRKLDTAGTTQIYQAKLAKNASVPLTMTYSIPFESTSGNKANVTKREATFDVVFTISGDTPNPTTSTTPPTSGGPTSTPTSGGPTSTTTPGGPTSTTSPPTPTAPATTTPSSSSSTPIKVTTGNEFDSKRAIILAILGAVLIGGAAGLLRRTARRD